MNTNEPMFISVEGIDGAGKSSVCNFIKGYLEEKTKINCTIARQNKTEPVGKIIREFIRHNPEAKTVSDKVYPFLFLAGIAETVENIIQPALDRGEWVISDRFTLSTAVYQNSTMTQLLLDDFERWFASPKYIFILDVPPPIIKKRILERKEEGDLFEDVPCETSNTRRKLFLDIANSSDREAIVIDASRPIEEVLHSVQKYLDNIIVKVMGK